MIYREIPGIEPGRESPKLSILPLYYISNVLTWNRTKILRFITGYATIASLRQIFLWTYPELNRDNLIANQVYYHYIISPNHTTLSGIEPPSTDLQSDALPLSYKGYIHIGDQTQIYKMRTCYFIQLNYMDSSSTRNRTAIFCLQNRCSSVEL
jgi:hypothetical protein